MIKFAVSTFNGVEFRTCHVRSVPFAPQKGRKFAYARGELRIGNLISQQEFNFTTEQILPASLSMWVCVRTNIRFVQTVILQQPKQMHVRRGVRPASMNGCLPRVPGAAWPPAPDAQLYRLASPAVDNLAPPPGSRLTLQSWQVRFHSLCSASTWCENTWWMTTISHSRVIKR